MNKGFVYTMVALFMLSLVVLAMVVPLRVDSAPRPSSQVNVDELFYFMESVQDDVQRAVDIASRRALVAVTNLAVNSGTPVNDSAGKTGEAFLNGTVGGNVSDLLVESSFRDWITKMEEQAAAEGYEINMSVDNSSLRAGMEDSFAVSIDFRYNLSVRDPRIETEFDRHRSMFNGSVSIEGVDDALLVLETAGKRFNSYNRCPNPSVEEAATGSVSEYNYTENGSERSWVSGDGRWFNGTDAGAVESPSEKILLTPDLCDYPFNDLEQFAGVVSDEVTTADDVCGSGEELPAYIGGVNTSRFGNGTRIVLEQDDVWRNFIPDQIDSRCYFPDEEGPDFFGRMEGNLTGDGNGLASFLDVPELPPEVQEPNRSAVDYVYFDSSGSYGPTRRIVGVTNHRDWFRLDEEHVTRWGAADLVY